MTQSIMGIVVPAKGAAYPWVVRRTCSWIAGLGHIKIRFRADCENAIASLAREVKEKRAEESEAYVTILEPARQGDKKAHGGGERGVASTTEPAQRLRSVSLHGPRST